MFLQTPGDYTASAPCAGTHGDASSTSRPAPMRERRSRRGRATGGAAFVIVAAFLVALSLMPRLAVAAEPVNLRRTPVVEVFETNRDAVVNINTTQTVRQRFGMFPDRFMDDPLFRRFFRGRTFERDVKRRSLGSGFIVHAAGYIVTNAHVVDRADEVDVILADGSELEAEVLASDAEQDLAIIKIAPAEGRELPTVELGTSSDLLVGEPVVAIGNPLGYQHTVTSGIISALDRTLPLTEQWQIAGLIQADAPINPGNSGGPLLNAYGQVIGITTAIRGDAQNIGFAIPVATLRRMIPELLSPLAINRVDLGGQVVEEVTIEPPAEVSVSLRWKTGDDETGKRI